MRINVHDDNNELSESDIKNVKRLTEDIQTIVDGEKKYMVINILISMALNQLARVDMPKEKLIEYISDSYDEIINHIEKEDA